MKCESCKMNVYHSAGSFQSVAEGGDDPYSYAYCAEGHWAGEEEPEPGEPEDIWANCKDYIVKAFSISVIRGLTDRLQS